MWVSVIFENDQPQQVHIPNFSEILKFGLMTLKFARAKNRMLFVSQ